MKEIEKDPDISATAKKEKWQELLKAYDKDNPYSREDEKLRAYAKERMFFWEHDFGRGIELRADRVTLKNEFPERIEYKILKNGFFWGKCIFFYDERTDKEGISSLKLTNFQAFGVTSQQKLITYLFSKDLSIYAGFVMRGREVISEVRLKDGIGFDGKKEKELVFKKIDAPNGIQRQHFIDFNYKVIDLLSSFIVVSQKVASGRFKHKERFNFLFDNKIRVVDMVYIGKLEVPFQGKLVSTEALAIRYQYVELLRFYIFKNQHGACFPVEVRMPTCFDEPSRIVKESSPRGKPKQRKIFVSNLSFIDARTLSSMTSKEEEELLNKAVNKGMNEVKKTSNRLAINVMNHAIPNTDANENKLVNILFDPNLTRKEKIDEITGDLMDAYDVDVIVTGQYIDDARNSLISLRTMLFSKSEPFVLIKNLQFTKEELFCTNPVNKEKILCSGAFDQISQAVKELLEEL